MPVERTEIQQRPRGARSSGAGANDSRQLEDGGAALERFAFGVLDTACASSGSRARGAEGAEAHAVLDTAAASLEPSARQEDSASSLASMDTALPTNGVSASRLGSMDTMLPTDEQVIAQGVLATATASGEPHANSRLPERRTVGVTKIGRFTVLDRLGQGGMGTVYAAYDDALDRKVAVKVLRVDAPGCSTESARLLREAQAMARLSHPNIATVHEVGEHRGRVFVAMEFVKGQSLDRWIRDEEGPRAWREVLQVFRQAGEGLAVAHAAGIVHRDFKPHNVMLGDDGLARVLDFGLARSLEHAGDANERTTPSRGAFAQMLGVALTRTGAIMGTPAYMAPEQHEGNRVDARCDQFSFCVSLYEGLYRQLPFDCSSLASLIESVTSGRIPAAPEGARVPTWIWRILLRGLSRDPAQRYPSMRALLDALARDPARARRRWIAASGIAALTVTTGFASAALSSGAPPCASADEELATVWNETRRAALQHAFVESGLGHAGATWTRIQRILDGWGERWVAQRAEACMAHESGVQSDRLLDLRMACLDRGRAGLDALLGIYATPDETQLDRAIEAFSGLPSLTRCADAEALLAEVAPPEDPSAAAQVRDARETLARAEAFGLAGRYNDAAALASEVEQLAAHIVYRPLVAEASLRRGAAQLEARDGVGAEHSLRSALTQALASGHQRVAAEAMARLLFVRSELLHKSALARDDEPLAVAMVERANDPELAWLLALNRGSLHEAAGDTPRATALYEEALAAIQLAGGTASHPHRALATHINLAYLAAGEGRYEDALSRYDDAEQLTREALGEQHPILASIAFNAASANLSIGQLKAASARLESADEVLRGAGPQHDVLRALLALLRAEILLTRGDHPQAEHYASRALTLMREVNDGASPFDVDALVILGTAALAHGATDEAGRRFAEANELSGDAQATIKLRVANAYRDHGNIDEAVQMFDDVLGALPNDDPRSTKARARAQLGLCRAALETDDERLASVACTEAQASAAAAGLPVADPLHLAITRANAELSLRNGDKNAVVQIEEVAAGYTRTFDIDHPERAAAEQLLTGARGR